MITFTEKVRLGDLESVDCPSREVLKHLTSLWGVLVILSLREGTLRFSELRRRAPGVSEKMLAQTLQALQGDGFVSRVSHPVVPPHVDYDLTPLGHEVAVQIASLTDWIGTHLHRVMDHRRRSGRADNLS